MLERENKILYGRFFNPYKFWYKKCGLSEYCVILSRNLLKFRARFDYKLFRLKSIQSPLIISTPKISTFLKITLLTHPSCPNENMLNFTKSYIYNEQKTYLCFQKCRQKEVHQKTKQRKKLVKICLVSKKICIKLYFSAF